nr:deoxyribodipyrimidine photo-lyase [Microvirga antarctica]
MAAPALVWFRDDRRMADNPALRAAIAAKVPVLCFFILDDGSPGLRPLGGAARWWLHGSLEKLAESLAGIGGELLLFEGPAEQWVSRIAAETGATAIYWNRRYGEGEIGIDSALKERLGADGVTVESFNGSLLHEPWEIKNQSGTPFRVFTPYSRTAMARPVPAPLPAPRTIPGGAWPADLRKASVSLSALRLEPGKPNWAKGLAETWTRGEAAARGRLGDFLDEHLAGYADKRERPGIDGSSRLSPYLRHGEISPRQVWHAVSAAMAENPSRATDGRKFLTELTWRDFCYQILYHQPDLATRSYSARFDAMPWSQGKSGLEPWQQGLTGYPIVDAGMRQLWQTGWMHNRIRMVVGSFLSKHLLIDWRDGEAWFWDTLVDADPANNAFNWQWVAGSGPDSAPFHRIFNPVTQGEKFDTDGAYVRRFVPELARLPDRFLHKPWDAPETQRADAGVGLGKTYPRPVVDHAAARARALDAFRIARGPVESGSDTAA